MTNARNTQRLRRATRSRSKMHGTDKRPRLVIYKSLKHLNAQIVDDVTGHVIFGVSTSSKTAQKLDMTGKIEYLAKTIADKLTKQKISSIIFDRSGYPFSGKVEKLASALKSKGITI